MRQQPEFPGLVPKARAGGTIAPPARILETTLLDPDYIGAKTLMQPHPPAAPSGT
jgi:hypothetical protein